MNYLDIARRYQSPREREKSEKSEESAPTPRLDLANSQSQPTSYLDIVRRYQQDKPNEQNTPAPGLNSLNLVNSYSSTHCEREKSEKSELSPDLNSLNSLISHSHKDSNTYCEREKSEKSELSPDLNSLNSLISHSHSRGFELVVDQAGLKTVRNHISTATIVGIDLETTGLNPRQDRIRLLTIAANGRTYVVDCFAVDPSPLFPILTRAELVGHHLAFDLGFLARLGFVPGKVWDSMLASQVLEAGLPVKHSLLEVSQRYLGVKLDKTEQLADWSGPLTESMLFYAAKDAEVPLKLREVMLPKLRVVRLEKVLDLEHRCLPALVSMALHGVGFDSECWVELTAEAEARRQELEAYMNDLLPDGEHIFGSGGCNWNSPEQVRRAFAAVGVHLDGTADEILATIDHPLAARLREYRGVIKRVGTYGQEWLRHVENGRVYPQWRQCSTATGRMSCSNPNMQQLPRDARYRQCFVAKEGHVLIKADYSQIELRLAAKIANEERMIEAYKLGEDLHTKTAQAILGKTEVTKADRQLAKAINFGLLYGMGAVTFAKYAQSNYGVILTEEEAQQYRALFFDAYPGLRRWHRQAGATDGRAITTRTLLGRQRFEVMKFTEKLNTPVQGSGADGLKAALALLWERRHECLSARVVLAVHDELVVEVPRDDAERAKEWLVRCMEDGMRPLLDPVPCVVEATIAPTWGG